MQLTKLGLPFRHSTGRADVAAVSVEQQSNLYHLISQVLAYEVEGELLEIGPLHGTGALMAQGIIDAEGGGQRLHVFDVGTLGRESRRPIERLHEPFEVHGGGLPILHLGDLWDVIPNELPTSIRYVNIDCGAGLRDAEHVELMDHLLAALYARLTRGAVCSVFDYCRHGWHDHLIHRPAGVRISTDRFLADKPEKIRVLHGGDSAHAYFRKQ